MRDMIFFKTQPLGYPYKLINRKLIHSLFFFTLTLMQFVFIFSLHGLSLEDKGEIKLKEIHSRLKLVHGSFSDEYPEQLMSAMFIPSNAVVLELGGNIGRNSCVIASLLDDSRNLVVIEPYFDEGKFLQINRDHNKLEFQIEFSAISKVPLVQSGWLTIPSDVDLPGFKRINTITFDELKNKYNLLFDTMVVDCEGALYYILRDDEEMLNQFQLILLENDFREDGHYPYVIDLFEKHGFNLVYNRAHGECSYFYQVWSK